MNGERTTDSAATLFSEASSHKIFRFAHNLRSQVLNDAASRMNLVKFVVMNVTPSESQPDLRRHCLALGIAAANGESAGEQWSLIEEGLLRLIDGDDDLGRFALNELTYVDQFLSGRLDGAGHIRDKLRNELLKRKARLDQTPGGLDYLRLALERPAIDTGEEKSDTQLAHPRLFVIGSVKGGVGKSSVSRALVEALSGSGEKTALIDLDFFGPSAQYAFDVPVVTHAHGFGAQEPHESTRWRGRWLYANLSDLIVVQNNDLMRDALGGTIPKYMLADFASPDKLAQEIALPVRSLDCAAVIALPDSPTFLNDFHRIILASEVVRGIRFYPNLVGLIDNLGTAGFKNVVIDLAPGLLGQNHGILRELAAYFSKMVHLVIVSSPRSLDLGTAVYEGTWIAADGNIEIASPVAHVVNMWDPDGVANPAERIGQYGDRTFQKLFSNAEPHSADAIAYSRWWSCLYAINCRESGRRFQLMGVPYFESLRKGAYDDTVDTYTEWTEFRTVLVQRLMSCWSGSTVQPPHSIPVATSEPSHGGHLV